MSDEKLFCPVAVTEYRHHGAVLADGIDVHAVAAHHEVHMDHGIVDTQLLALLEGLIVVITDTIGEATANCQVAGSIFIKEGFIEQQTTTTRLWKSAVSWESMTP